jgi:hypothetical protein
VNRTERVESADRFAVHYEALGQDARDTGRIARLPWDSDIFGFGVADYEPPAETTIEPVLLADRLAAWEERNAVDLVSCRISAASALLADRLSGAGFRFLELQLRATLPRLSDATLRAPRLTVRTPAPEDGPRLIEIAGTAFRFGRYHADPRFPRALADRRYQVWVEGALADRSEQTRLFVTGPVGQPVGFVHVVIAEGVADLRLAGVDPDDTGIAGPELFLGALKQLALAGVGRVTARLSAANTSAVNLYASMSFRFHEPQLVFHRGEPPFAADRMPSA